MGNNESRIANEKLNEQKKQDLERRFRLVDEDIERLRAYYLGSMTDIAQFQQNGLDRLEIKRIRIGLFGPTGAGKSSFINTCERTLRHTGRGTCNVQSTGEEGTVMLIEFLHDFFFRLVDTRGFYHYTSIQPFVSVIEGLIEEGAIIRADDVPQNGNNTQKGSISDQINVVIFFIKGTDPNLSTAALFERFSLHRQYLRENGVTAVTVVTHYDIVPAAEREKIRLDASRATGSPVNKTFFITNYTQDDCIRDIFVEEQAIKVLQYALSSAEQTIRIKMQQQKHKTPGHVANMDITVISRIHGHDGRFVYTVPVHFTFGNLLATVKIQFKAHNANNFYFTTSQGKILSSATKVQGYEEVILQMNAD